MNNRTDVLRSAIMMVPCSYCRAPINKKCRTATYSTVPDGHKDRLYAAIRDGYITKEFVEELVTDELGHPQVEERRASGSGGVRS